MLSIRDERGELLRGGERARTTEEDGGGSIGIEIGRDGILTQFRHRRQTKLEYEAKGGGNGDDVGIVEEEGLSRRRWAAAV